MAARARWWVGGVLLACVFALALTRIEDTDAWTHLALGRHLVAERGFPPAEAFDFPSLHLPYYNPEWLFGVLFYLAWAAGGLSGVILLKAAIVTLAFFVLFRDSLSPPNPAERGWLGAVAVVAVLLPVALIVRHRFVERPDIVLMVFLAFTIYALNAYVGEGRRYLFLLPPLAVLWANMHPSVVVGLVPFVALLVGGALQHWLRAWRGIELPGTPSARQLRVVAAVGGAVGLGALVNPYGIEPFLAPVRLATAEWLRHEIQELQAPSFSREAAPFVITALLVLSFALTRRRLSIVSVLLVTPFAGLGLSARRFIFLLALVAAPLLARTLRVAMARLQPARTARLAVPTAVVAMVAGVVATGLAVAGVGPLADPLKIPGVGINHDSVPEGALRYLDRVEVTGRVLNTYQWGGYLAWRDFPRRLPAVDGRGYLPAGLLDDLLAARGSPARLERLRATYGFDVAVLDYPLDRGTLREETPDTDLGLQSSDWALVYWDDVALVYLRREGPYRAFAERDEYRQVKPASGAFHLRRRLKEGVPFAAVEAELRRNIGETGSATALALLGFAFNEVGRYASAIEMLERVLASAPAGNLYNAYQGLAFAHLQLGDAARAIEDYQRAARIREDPVILYNIGVAAAKSGRDREAIRYLERALARDRNLVAAYPVLIAAYRRAGLAEQARAVEAGQAGALVRDRAGEHFRRGVRHYLDGRPHEAIVELLASLQLNPGNPSALSNLGYVYFDLGRLDEALAQQQRALEIDPGFANAHYGLGLIYERRRDPARARRHFAEYVRLDPRGYWSRRAREALDRLSGG